MAIKKVVNVNVFMDSFSDVRPVATCCLSPVFIKCLVIRMDGNGAVIIKLPFTDILQGLDVHAV